MLGRDIVQKNAIARWGDGVVNQLSLDLRNAFPDVKGFSSGNLYYMKEWYEFYWIIRKSVGNKMVLKTVSVLRLDCHTPCTLETPEF